MTSTTSNPKLSAGRIAAFAGIVCLSMALPIGIIHWSFASAFADKPFGLKSSEQKHYDEGTVKSHELFFGAYRSLDHTGLETFDWRFKRLNLHSGIEEESGLVIPPEWCAPRWVKNELFAISAYATFRMGESSFEEPVTRPGQLSTFHWLLFPYDDRMTAIVDADDGRFQLQHLFGDNYCSPLATIRIPGGNSDVFP